MTTQALLNEAVEETAAGAKTRILVVDDVADNRDILIRRLERRGFETVEASCGRDGLALMLEQDFDIVLLDIMMPDLNGNDVLREVRTRKSELELPVIMVSAKSEGEDVVESLSLGANDYVTKPIDFNVALARIANQVARKESFDTERRNALRLQDTVQAERTQRQHSDEQLRYFAYHDALTGLLNRNAFRDVLGQAVDNLIVSDSKPAVLFIDLDRFKAVNDAYGHDVGDKLLRAVAERLQATLAPGSALCRLGGDEFGVLVAEGGARESASAQADRLVTALKHPFDIDGHVVELGASCGVALASSELTDFDELVRAADLAMYHAKKTGRTRAVVFEPRMLLEHNERRAMEKDLRAAIRQGEFEVFYQPLVNTRTETVHCFEALVRWHHQTLGLIAPDDFIPIAEDTGLIVEIGEWVLRMACKEATTWPADISVAVNLSPVQFRNPNLLGSVVSALAASGLEPKRLELEITETVLLGVEKRNQEVLRSLRELGVRISIDDFGTGYSSMSYLQNFVVDKLKIDKRFVQGLENDKGSAAIIHAIINLGLEIGVDTSAEGVETKEQLKCVIDRGCTIVQGYLFSRPLTSEDARAFIQSYSKRDQN